MTSTQLRPFSDWITDHARGTVDDEITVAIAQVTEAVAHLAKKGEVVIKIRIDSAGSGGRTVSTAVIVEAKPPLADPEQSIFYVGDQGTLHRQDPYQSELDIRTVDADTGEIRHIPTES